MKKNILVKAAAIFVVASVSFGVNAKCSTKTLKGMYVFNTHGTVDGAEYSDAGNELFDGKGNVSGDVFTSEGERRMLVGTYEVNAQCDGTIIYTQPAPAVEHIFLGKDGKVFTYIQADERTQASGTEIRQGSGL